MKNKRLKIGAYSTVVSLIAIAIAVIVNMVVGIIPSVYTKFDTTGYGLYELSEDTEQIVKGVEDDVTLYLVARSGKEDATILEVLNRYTPLNNHITVKTADPEVTPSMTTENGTAHDLSSMTENSVIAVSAKRDYDVAYDTIFTKPYTDQQMAYIYQLYGQVPDNPTSFAGEQAITSAIDNITTDEIPIVYTLTGHGETEFGESLSGYLTTDNFDSKSLALTTGDGSVPADASCIVINNPTADINSDELETLMTYVDGGGKLVLVTNFNQKGTDYANLNALGSYYGMNAVDGLVMETDSNYYYQSQYYLIPNISTSSDITAEMNGKSVIMPTSGAFTVSDELRDGVTVTPLLTTSDSAYTVKIVDNTIDAENHIYDGACVLGAIATVSTGDDDSENAAAGSFVWYTSYGITDDSADSAVSGGNSTLFLATLSNLCDKKASVSIAAKSMSTDSLVITENATNIWSTVFTIIIPLVIIVIGFGVWYSRRKK